MFFLFLIWLEFMNSHFGLYPTENSRMNPTSVKVRMKLKTNIAKHNINEFVCVIDIEQQTGGG